ncbi:probable apyrase 6 [Abrus precatorius]|uniref:Probable apyrase 6 n=1 Tax=Abrus precatorius TaxID=3816 RepID=A0A8B8KPW4_ABRPR|nr:probable apyrase 6 [Abrus precatorius]
MDFPNNLQPRPSSSSSSYIPPHRTQLHPRMISVYSSSLSSSSSNQKPHTTKCLLFLFAFLFFTAPFLFYLFSTALQIHSSPKFSDSHPAFSALVLRAGPSALRLSLFHFLGPTLLAGAHSASARPGFAAGPAGVRGAAAELVEFAQGRVPKREWGSTKVQVVATEELEGLGAEAVEKVLECCRQVLRESGFLFKDEWARVVSGEEQGISSWVAVNYALGNLGREPQETTGIVELGGASLQVTSAKLNAELVQSSRTIRLSGVKYNLYTRSWPQLGQDVAWKSLEERLKYRELKLSSKSNKRNLVNPCIPRGYEYPWISNASYVKHPVFQPAGNFSVCRSEALSLLKRTEERCLHPPCKITSSFYESLGEQVSSRSFLYTSEILRMAPGTSLFELGAAGQHYCENHWDALKDQHNEIDYLDLLKYCFSSAYMLALLHDVLGIAVEEKRIGFGNQKIYSHVDWTLGSFLIETMAEPLDLEHIDTGMIVGNESVTYFSLFAFLFLIILAAFFVMQWRKPQLKTVYDLEKGHYIVTRIPR